MTFKLAIYISTRLVEYMTVVGPPRRNAQFGVQPDHAIMHTTPITLEKRTSELFGIIGFIR